MKTTWITGASGAMGSALARKLVANGETVVLTARNMEALNALATELGPAAHVYAGDVNHAEEAQRIIEQAQAAIGPITGLAHCVGSTVIKPLHLTSVDDFQQQIQTNFFTAANTLKAFVAAARKHRQPAAAVLVGSVVAQAGFPNHEAIGAAKAAVAALAMSTAATYADKGIRVNCIHPGLVESALSARLTGTPEAKARSASMNPSGRIGHPQDAASLMAFLLSEDASWITAQQIGLDGGQALIHPLPKA